MNEAILAEVVLGNISNMNEALNFIKATFFYVRLFKNPHFYGIKDPENIDQALIEIVKDTLEELHHLRLIRYDASNNIIESTELGRISSHYYVNC